MQYREDFLILRLFIYATLIDSRRDRSRAWIKSRRTEMVERRNAQADRKRVAIPSDCRLLRASESSTVGGGREREGIFPDTFAGGGCLPFWARERRCDARRRSARGAIVKSRRHFHGCQCSPRPRGSFSGV